MAMTESKFLFPYNLRSFISKNEGSMIGFDIIATQILLIAHTLSLICFLFPNPKLFEVYTQLVLRCTDPKLFAVESLILCMSSLLFELHSNVTIAENTALYLAFLMGTMAIVDFLQHENLLKISVTVKRRTFLYFMIAMAQMIFTGGFFYNLIILFRLSKFSRITLNGLVALSLFIVIIIFKKIGVFDVLARMNIEKKKTYKKGKLI